MVTSGAALRETVDTIRSGGDEPLTYVVVVDRQGVEETDGVPVHSLVNIVRVGKQ